MTKKSFIKGAAVLGAAGLIVKMIGVLYRIPLQWIIGDDGLGIYHKAYPAYALLLMISTAGLPPAVSKLVASHMARGDKAGANKVFRVALGLLSVAGLVASLILFIFSKQIAVIWAKDPLAQMSIAYIAPAIFFVAIMAAVRGYFQGMQNMFPTAMTQLVEQVGKVAMGLLFASLMISRGIEYGAAGAILGVMASEFVAMAVILVYYFVKREKAEITAQDYEKTNEILKKILKLAIPILIGASIMPLITFLDANIISDRLLSIGFTQETARPIFGIYTGRVNPLVNVPGTVSLAFCVSIVAAVSSYLAVEDMDAVRRNTKTGFKMAMLVGIPSAVGLGVLSTPIMNLLYHSSSPESNQLAGNLLAILAGGVIFLSILQTLNGVLQGLGKVMVPVAALGSGAVVKVVLSYVLIGIPEVGIYGAPISTFACYAIAAVIDIVMVKKLTGVKFGIMECVIRPALASAVMGVVAWAVYHFAHSLIGGSFATLAAVLIGVLVFLICIPVFNVMKRNEIMALPGGGKLVKGYDKLSRGRKNA
jgi:stage V sporulation protein B